MIEKSYFDKDYFETPDIKSGYNLSNFNRNSYLYEAIAIWLNEFLPLANARILEIGCAYGWLVEQLVSLYSYDAYGQDISTWSVSHKPQQIRDRVFECNDVEICLDGQFDIILSFETFEHVPEAMVSTYVKNMYDCLDDGGVLFATICLGWNNDRGSDPDESHQTLQPRSWWDSIFKEAGFIARKDLEADAYEIGIQTSRMEHGQFLARHFNWHVFAYQKEEDIKQIASSVENRISMSPKQNLLILGQRIGEWRYPILDFFQIDNWGNYLSEAFNCDYLGFEIVHEKDISKYDVVIASLSPLVASCINTLDLSHTKLVGFIEGTPYLIETPNHRPIIIECIKKCDLIYSTIPKGRDLFGLFCDKQKIMNCGHIFPIASFDKHFQRKHHNGFNVMTGGYFNSRHGFASISAYIGARVADTVIAMTTTEYLAEFHTTGEKLPNNVVLTETMDQELFWSNILPNVDLLIHLANEPAQGRLTAECAAAGIPSIGPENLFQVRCFPELTINHLYDIDEILNLSDLIKSDVEFREDLSTKGRERLIASNSLEIMQMARGLKSIGFDIELQ